MSNMNKEEQILAYLKANPNGVTNIELAEIALRYGGYLGNLYKKGYNIKTIPIGNGVHKYKLISCPDEDFEEKPKAIDLLLKEIESHDFVNASEFENILEKLNISVKYRANTYK